MVVFLFIIPFFPPFFRPGCWDRIIGCVFSYWHVGGPPDPTGSSLYIWPSLQGPRCSHHQGGRQAGPLLPAPFPCPQPQWDTAGHHSGTLDYKGLYLVFALSQFRFIFNSVTLAFLVVLLRCIKGSVAAGVLRWYHCYCCFVSLMKMTYENKLYELPYHVRET